MKILFVHTGSDLYGASRSLLRLVRRLKQEGHNVRVVLPCEGPLVAEFSTVQIPVDIDSHMPLLVRNKMRTPLGFFPLLYSFVISFFFLRRLIQQFKPDLIHTNTASVLSPVGLTAKPRKIPHLWHIREWFGDHPLLWRYFQQWMGKYSNRILAVSEAVANQFSPPVKQKVTVLHNGFPAGEFPRPDPDRIASFRKQYGLTDNLLVGVVGRIKLRRKGQEVFLKAIARIKDQHASTRFLLIGSPFPGNETHLEKVLTLRKQLGLESIVTYTGDVPDIKTAISALDLVVLPSAQPEPFGGIVIEAMALYKPVIGTRCGGTVEQIEDQVTGILVQPNDPEELAQAMDRLLRNPSLRTQMGLRGHERYLAKFEFEMFYSKLTQIYQQELSA